MRNLCINNLQEIKANPRDTCMTFKLVSNEKIK